MQCNKLKYPFFPLNISSPLDVMKYNYNKGGYKYKGFPYYTKHEEENSPRE